MVVSIKALKKKLAKLERDYDKNDKAIVRNARIVKKAERIIKQIVTLQKGLGGKK